MISDVICGGSHYNTSIIVEKVNNTKKNDLKVLHFKRADEYLKFMIEHDNNLALTYYIRRKHQQAEHNLKKMENVQ